MLLRIMMACDHLIMSQWLLKCFNHWFNSIKLRDLFQCTLPGHRCCCHGKQIAIATRSITNPMLLAFLWPFLAKQVGKFLTATKVIKVNFFNGHLLVVNKRIVWTQANKWLNLQWMNEWMNELTDEWKYQWMAYEKWFQLSIHNSLNEW